MVRENKHGLMEAHMMVNGSMDYKKDKANKCGQMLILNIKEIGKLA